MYIGVGGSVVGVAILAKTGDADEHIVVITDAEGCTTDVAVAITVVE